MPAQHLLVVDDRLVLGLSEVARLLGLSRETVRQAVVRGEIPAIRIGRKYLVARHDLLALLAGRFADDPLGRGRRSRGVVP